MENSFHSVLQGKPCLFRKTTSCWKKKKGSFSSLPLYSLSLMLGKVFNICCFPEVGNSNLHSKLSLLIEDRTNCRSWYIRQIHLYQEKQQEKCLLLLQQNFWHFILRDLFFVKSPQTRLGFIKFAITKGRVHTLLIYF